jgi:hypothetical protein
MRSFAIGVLTVAITASLIIPAAYAQNCQQLWVERNSYYKARGYCFKTERAISYFGNGGCIYRDEDRVPLTQRERNRIDEIKRLERAYGCD